MSQTSLRALEHHDAFLERHIGPNDAEITHMLRVVGHDSLEALTNAIVPGSIKSGAPLALPAPISEVEAIAKIRAIADKNQVFRSSSARATTARHTPNVILRNILENPAWYTAYTPYQAEISQGRMEALINFQTMCADLTGMEIANASLLDEATAAAEAMTLAKRSCKSKSNTSSSPAACTRSRSKSSAPAPNRWASRSCRRRRRRDEPRRFGVLLQYPNTFGQVSDYKALADAVHARGGLVAVATDLLALTLIAAPANGAPISSSATRSASACRSVSVARTLRSWPAVTRTSARCRAA
jgi:glycine dehydrogenase